MSSKGPNTLEFLVVLIPLFMVIPAIFVVLLAVSLQAKRRESEQAKALPSETADE
jgi:hypothetical protein